MTMVHTFIDFIPSIFLGAPNDETALSSLPGHRMLLKGLGYEATKLTAIGCFLGTIAALILSIFFIKTAPIFYPFLTKIMAFVLIALSVFLILTEKGKTTFISFIYRIIRFIIINNKFFAKCQAS
jgi:putative membrane protein